MRTWVLGLVCLCAGNPTEQIQSWNPTLDDVKPFKYHVFGDSTKVALQPVFNEKTYQFINTVLNAQPEFTVNELRNQKTDPSGSSTSSSPFQELVPMVKLNRSFFEHDFDRSGRLELREAKNIFDKFHIFFNSVEELNSYFDNGFINFVDYCDMLKAKNVITSDEKLQYQLAYLNSIFLGPKDLPDREVLRTKLKAVYWAFRYLENNPNEQLPTPPQDLVPQELLEVAKQTIVRAVAGLTGRSHVTFETAHLSKDKADEIEQTRRSQTYLCHPGDKEECSTQQPCCRDLKCCLIGETRKGYCANECQRATNETQIESPSNTSKFTYVSSEQHDAESAGIPFVPASRDDNFVLGQPKSEDKQH